MLAINVLSGHQWNIKEPYRRGLEKSVFYPLGKMKKHHLEIFLGLPSGKYSSTPLYGYEMEWPIIIVDFVFYSLGYCIL